RKVHRTALRRLAGLDQPQVLGGCRELFEIVNRLRVGGELVVRAWLKSERRLRRRHAALSQQRRRGCEQKQRNRESSGRPHRRGVYTAITRSAPTHQSPADRRTRGVR